MRIAVGILIILAASCALMAALELLAGGCATAPPLVIDQAPIARYALEQEECLAGDASLDDAIACVHAVRARWRDAGGE